MKTHHFFIDQTGVLKVIQEMPVKSKTIYDKAIQKAKEDAIEVMSQHEVKDKIFRKYGASKGNTKHAFLEWLGDSVYYELECNVKIINGVNKPGQIAIVAFGDLRPIEELFVESYFGLKDVNENHPITTDYGHLVNLLTGFKEKHMKH